MDATSQRDDAPANLAQQVAALRAEVTELRARLEAQEAILQIRAAAGPAAAPTPPVAADVATRPPLATGFDITADQLLPAHDGFYRLEWGTEGAFRWTGPGSDVHFDAWIDRSVPVVVTLSFFHFGTPANAKEMTLEVDGATHALTRQGSEKVLRSDPVPPREGDGPTRITLRVPHLHSPAARGLADKRTLGVAFQRLQIERA